MANPDEGPIDDATLAEVTRELVALHEQYHGREPATARVQMMGDDLLACILGDVYSDVEKTLIDARDARTVYETRSRFQAVMKNRFIAIVERVCGRPVVGFISTHHADPDLEIELFVLGAVETTSS